MNKERLERLHAVLLGVEAERKSFDMNHWITDVATAEEEGALVRGEADTCGTACCAFGYAALDPVLREQGLGLRVYVVGALHGGRAAYAGGTDPVEVSSVREYNALVKEHGAIRCAVPHFKGAEDWGAAQAFFGVSYGVAEYLFDPMSYPGGGYEPIPARDVAERVRDVIERGGEDPRDPGEGE